MSVAPIHKPSAPTVSDAPKAPAAPKAPVAPTAGETKAPKAPKAPKEPKEQKESNFKRVYPDSAKITVITADGKNPKRAGSKAHATFELYATSANVGEFIKAGGFYAALSWDVGHGFIKVEA